MNGVLLLGAEAAGFETELADAGYLTHSLATAVTVDDIAAALLELKQRTPGALAALAVGPITAVLLEAATQLPQLDACVLVEPRMPASHPHYARMRVQIQLHRFQSMTAAEVTALRDAASPGCVQILDWSDYAASPLTDPDDRVIAWDRIRDFLATSLPMIDAV